MADGGGDDGTTTTTIRLHGGTEREREMVRVGSGLMGTPRPQNNKEGEEEDLPWRRGGGTVAVVATEGRPDELAERERVTVRTWPAQGGSQGHETTRERMRRGLP